MFVWQHFLTYDGLVLPFKRLKKRQASVKLTFSRPKGSTTELEFEGALEELRKDKRMHQKTVVLYLRSALVC